MQEENFATFVNVILPLHLQQVYTYRVPAEWEQEIAIGKRVAIQFGAKKVYSALIYQIHHQPPKNYEAKYIYSVLDESPVVDAQNFLFWDWISKYYLCSLGDVMQAALPAALKLESATRVIANPSFELNQTVLDDKEYLVYEALEIRHELTLEEIAEIIQLKNVFPLLKSMVKKEMILIKEELEERYKEKKLTCLKLATQFDDEAALEALFAVLERNEKQLNILMAYLHLKQHETDIDRALLLKTCNGTTAPLNTLIKKGIFETYQISIDRIQIAATPLQKFELNEAQELALTQIKNQWEEKEIVLLQGVTGSGKTHVYVRLIQEQMALGKQVLFLLPEIALTSQIVKRIRKFFGEACISYHSKFNDQEKVEIWHKVKEGKYQIVIGARSAVFLPFANLGLCIVDEEHEGSYKQQDPAPRYHARDAAMMLAKLNHCKTILGSATPSLEVHFMAQQNKYGWVKMDNRFFDVAMPAIETANIAEERRVKTMVKEDISFQLSQGIEQALANNEQVILFQNRRGYAPFLSCNTCEWVPKCQNCDISLTYHKYIDSLKCHYCGYTAQQPKTCGACGSTHLSLKGVGTEKVEDELNELYPLARIARLDLDAAKTKNGHEEIIRSFEEQQFDILVGTQMLSKGLDFEHVSLVGVINADSLLSFPDFRAHERAMQLLMQVSGRAGRKHKQGKVIIQTSMPNHFVLQALLNKQYEALMERELEERQKFAYPPFFRIIKVVLKHKDFKVVEQAALRLKYLMQGNVKATMLGPESPYVSKIRNFYIKEILVKISRTNPELESIKQAIKKAMADLGQEKVFRSVIVFADVDPG
ncbi:MAG: primosomal protein N' [Bacteroidetes bacterium B1(2017)]|nr:MAG: primosomal protein N' [Bacteroidetes bacterium B1(2017)]